MNYDLLFTSASSEKLELAIIGVGGFNHSLFTYGMRNEKLSIRVLCGRNIRKCVDAYVTAGVDPGRYRSLHRSGKRVLPPSRQENL